MRALTGPLVEEAARSMGGDLCCLEIEAGE